MTAVATMTETEIQKITFSAGLPGFPEAHTFVLLHTELAQEPFAILRCLEDQELEFVVTQPQLFFPDYAPVIDDATVSRIGLERAEDALLLTILTVGDDIASVTANLMGPVVINTKNNSGAQAVLANQDLELRKPLFSETLVGSGEDA